MIIYLHGFGSTGSSPKVDALRKRFGTDNVIAPDLPMDPEMVSKLVDNLVKLFLKFRKESEKLIFVGTSLGAFYANYFGHLYDCPIVVVNPSGKPSETLQSKLGVNYNYLTGEEFIVSVAHLEKLNVMRQYIQESYSPSLINLFVAKDDEVISYETMLENFPHVKVTMMEDGGHRFTKHWDKVVDRIESLLETDKVKYAVD